MKNNINAVFMQSFLKGQCHEIFDLWFFHQTKLPLSPDTRVKAFLHMAWNSRRYSTLKSPIFASAAEAKNDP
jgi:hypothetical protein